MCHYAPPPFKGNKSIAKCRFQCETPFDKNAPTYRFQKTDKIKDSHMDRVNITTYKFTGNNGNCFSMVGQQYPHDTKVIPQIVSQTFIFISRWPLTKCLM